MPLVAMTSFTAIGTPAITESSSPAARRSSMSGGRQGAVGVDVEEGVDLAVDRRDPVEVRLATRRR